jgi:hypothetical protein
MKASNCVSNLSGKDRDQAAKEIEWAKKTGQTTQIGDVIWTNLGPVKNTQDK